MTWRCCRRKFLSTPSARRATYNGSMFTKSFEISIHALREEGDPASVGFAVAVSRFLSTPSARRATTSISVAFAFFLFLSTPSARRATCSYQ